MYCPFRSDEKSSVKCTSDCALYSGTRQCSFKELNENLEELKENIAAIGDSLSILLRDSK